VVEVGRVQAAHERHDVCEDGHGVVIVDYLALVSFVDRELLHRSFLYLLLASLSFNPMEKWQKVLSDELLQCLLGVCLAQKWVFELGKPEHAIQELLERNGLQQIVLDLEAGGAEYGDSVWSHERIRLCRGNLCFFE